MVTRISHSPAETETLGRALGETASAGLLLGLCGDLGAGKTQFVKGLARGLGIIEVVHSPTFSLVNAYSGGRLPLAHLDLYRLETEDQIIGAGLEDYLKFDGVVVVEWADRWPALPRAANYQQIRFEPLGENERRITYEHPGA